MHTRFVLDASLCRLADASSYHTIGQCTRSCSLCNCSQWRRIPRCMLAEKHRCHTDMH